VTAEKVAKAAVVGVDAAGVVVAMVRVVTARRRVTVMASRMKMAIRLKAMTPISRHRLTAVKTGRRARKATVPVVGVADAVVAVDAVVIVARTAATLRLLLLEKTVLMSPKPAWNPQSCQSLMWRLRLRRHQRPSRSVRRAVARR
jgi:hypothetical protein